MDSKFTPALQNYTNFRKTQESVSWASSTKDFLGFTHTHSQIFNKKHDILGNIKIQSFFLCDEPVKMIKIHARHLEKIL